MRIHFVAIAILILLAALTGVALAHEGDPQTITVHMTEGGFEPEDVTIQQGNTVIFENIDTIDRWPASNIHPTHRLYPNSDIDDCDTDKASAMFDSCGNVEQGDTYSFTFNHAGTWKFHDHNAPQFTGSVVVEKTEEFENTEEVKESDTPANFVSSVKLFFTRIYYTIFPSKAEKRLAEVDMLELANEKGEELTYWLTAIGTEAVMEELLSDSSLSGIDCHQAAHNVGRRSYELFDAEVFSKCSAECHSGCYHGGTEAYFRDHGTENLEEDLNVLCNSDLNAFFSHQCIHGVGHGLMAWSDYEIFEALENCNLLSGQEASCYSGVFMENIVGGLAPEQGHFTQYLSEDLHFPCNILPEKYVGGCYFYQTSRMLSLFQGDFAKVANACSEIEKVYQNSCFASMGRDVGGVNMSDPAGAIEDCGVVADDESRQWCLNGAVQNTFWDPSGQEEALEFCSLLKDTQEKKACYGVISARAIQVLTSKEDVRSFCQNIEEAHRSNCPTTL